MKRNNQSRNLTLEERQRLINPVGFAYFSDGKLYTTNGRSLTTNEKIPYRWIGRYSIDHNVATYDVWQNLASEFLYVLPTGEQMGPQTYELKTCDTNVFPVERNKKFALVGDYVIVAGRQIALPSNGYIGSTRYNGSFIVWSRTTVFDCCEKAIVFEISDLIAIVPAQISQHILYIKQVIGNIAVICADKYNTSSSHIYSNPILETYVMCYITLDIKTVYCNCVSPGVFGRANCKHILCNKCLQKKTCDGCGDACDSIIP